jgi:hypothetical protein
MRLVFAVVSTILPGFRLTHQKLLQAVPIVGAVFNAGMNAGAVALLHDRAQEACRLRFLTEKYRLAAAEWLANVAGDGDEDTDDLQIDLEQLIRDEQDGDDHPEQSAA